MSEYTSVVAKLQCNYDFILDLTSNSGCMDFHLYMHACIIILFAECK